MRIDVSGRDVREWDDARIADGPARPPTRGGATNHLPTAHERADSGTMVSMTGDEDADNRGWHHHRFALKRGTQRKRS